jgi:hypothetical protein
VRPGSLGPSELLRETRLAVYENPTGRWDGHREHPCWVRHQRERSRFAVNARICCPAWFAQSRLFMCPCHGGAYYEDGARVGRHRGPFEYEYQVKDGQLCARAAADPLRPRC